MVDGWIEDRDWRLEIRDQGLGTRDWRFDIGD
jgi:hypothetical protein